MSEEHTETTAPPEWEKFLAGIDKLNATVTDLRSDMRQAPQEEPEPEPEPQAEPVGLSFPEGFDEMTPKQQHSWMLQTFGKVVTEQIVSQVQAIVKPLQEASQHNQQAVLEERYAREITALKAETKDGKPLRPDFDDFLSEMVEIVKENPGIRPDRAYALARAENPKKTAELDAKHNPPPPAPKKPFSFAPGSGGEAAGTGPKKVDNATAFQRAYAQVSARHPGVLPNLE